MTTRATPTPPAGTAPHPWRSLALAASGLTVVGVVLWWTGNALPGPGSYDRGGFTAWLGDTDPVVAAFAVIRLLGLALVAWTLLTGALALVASRTRLRRRRRLRRMIDRLCFPVVRRLVHGAAGVAIAAATITPGSAGATADGGARQFATVMAIEDVATTGPAPDTDAQLARVVALDPAPEPLRRPPDRTGPTIPATEAARQLPATWELRRGEHLWHVAEATLTAHLGRSPDDEETSAYLRVLVEANDHRLAVPGNPDLVLAGQVVELPDPADLFG